MPGSTLEHLRTIGALGGSQRAKNLGKEKLSEAMRKTVEARWSKPGAKKRSTEIMRKAWARRRANAATPKGAA